MGKVKNLAGNTVSIPGRAVGTVGLVGADVIKTNWGALQDTGSVIINTTNKIVDLFSQNQKRYEKALNIPVAAGVGLAGAVEAVVKPIVNKAGNYGKTALNFITNSRKSTFGSLFSTKPASDTKFNTIKWRGKEVHIDTEKRILNPNNLWTKNRGFLGEEKRIAKEEQNAELEAKMRELGAAA